MKKICLFLLCAVLFFSICTPCSAASEEEVIYCSQTDLANGIVCTEVITVSGTQTKSSTKTATTKRTYTYSDEIIAVISVKGTFSYDGSTVSVISKSITECETYDGWSFKQSSFTSSGGTITLDGKLTKLIVLNANISISLSCDKDGNIS